METLNYVDLSPAGSTAAPMSEAAAPSLRSDQHAAVPGITEFLTARLDEAEALARAAAGEWDDESARYEWQDLPDASYAHARSHDPARVLRDIEADRKLLAAYAEVADMDRDDPEPEFAYGRAVGLGEAVRLRAARFSDHPDYDLRWQTDGPSAP